MGALSTVAQSVRDDLIRRGIRSDQADLAVRRAVNRMARRRPVNVGVPPGLIRAHKAPLYGTSMALGQGIEVLAGPGQAYYDRLNKVQNHVIGLQAEMAEIGKDNWDLTLQSNLDQVVYEGWIPVENYLFDPMMAWWRGLSKQVITTASVRPSEATVSDVENKANGTDKLIAFVKSMLPEETASAAEAYRAEALAKVAKASLTSPGDVARQTVIDDIRKKVGGLFSKGLVIAGIAVAAGVGVLVLLKRK